MNRRSPLRLALLVLSVAIGSRAHEGVQMIMPNGTRIVVEAEDIAVDVADATGRALPEDEGELKNLLNWAISEHLVLCISMLMHCLDHFMALDVHEGLRNVLLAGSCLCMCPGSSLLFRHVPLPKSVTPTSLCGL